MDFGMLWFDDDPKRSLDEKIAKAAHYYFLKYKIIPTACMVHPKALPDGETQLSVIKVTSGNFVLPNHLWIGVE